ncbi:MAG: LicD family protein, partial [Chlamydiota bacterium]
MKLHRWFFASFVLLFASVLPLYAFSQESSPLTTKKQSVSRLLVSVSASASFSAEELAEALSAEYIKLDSRNPFKDFPTNFLDYPLVITSLLGPDTLLKLSKRFGYRCATFSEESLEQAIQLSTELCQSGPKTSSDLPQVSKDEAHLIYELLSKVDTIFKAHDITYWATGGTLMGALRYQGLMPWDDDVDVCILDADEKKLEGIAADLDSLGLGMVKRDIYKIFFKEGIFVEDY